MTPEAFRDALTRSGITPEKPLYPVLLTVWEAAETARAAATEGARGLTAEGERALIDKVGGEVAIVAEREVEQLMGRLDLRRALQSAALGLVLLGAGYGVGRWDGERQGAAAIEGSVFLAQIAALNDARHLAQRCRETQRPTQGEWHASCRWCGLSVRRPPARLDGTLHWMARIWRERGTPPIRSANIAIMQLPLGWCLQETRAAPAPPLVSAAVRFRLAVDLHGAVEAALDLGLFGQSLGQLRLDRGALALRKMAAPQLGPQFLDVVVKRDHRTLRLL